MTRIRFRARANAEAKTSEESKKPAKPMASTAARKNVLGRISKPSKKAVSQLLLYCRLCLMNLETKKQKKSFKEFLTRLEERDEKLEQTDLEVSTTFRLFADSCSIMLLQHRLHQKAL
jgi:hypothetical protein